MLKQMSSGGGDIPGKLQAASLNPNKTKDINEP